MRQSRNFLVAKKKCEPDPNGTAMAAKNNAARLTRNSIRITGPSTGTLMRVNRNEAPQMAARVSSLTKLARFMMYPENLEGCSIAEYKARFHPILAVLMTE